MALSASNIVPTVETVYGSPWYVLLHASILSQSGITSLKISTKDCSSKCQNVSLLIALLDVLDPPPKGHDSNEFINMTCNLYVLTFSFAIYAAWG